MVDWALILQIKCMKINKDNTRKKIKVVNYDYNTRDILMLNNRSLYKYGTPYNGISEIIQCWTIGTVTLEMGTIQIRYNITHIKTY